MPDIPQSRLIEIYRCVDFCPIGDVAERLMIHIENRTYVYEQKTPDDMTPLAVFRVPIKFTEEIEGCIQLLERLGYARVSSPKDLVKSKGNGDGELYIYFHREEGYTKETTVYAADRFEHIQVDELASKDIDGVCHFTVPTKASYREMIQTLSYMSSNVGELYRYEVEEGEWGDIERLQQIVATEGISKEKLYTILPQLGKLRVVRSARTVSALLGKDAERTPYAEIASAVKNEPNVLYDREYDIYYVFG